MISRWKYIFLGGLAVNFQHNSLAPQNHGVSHCFGGTLRINLHSYQVSAGQIAMLMGTPLKYQAVAGATLLFHYDQSIYIYYICVCGYIVYVYIYIYCFISPIHIYSVNWSLRCVGRTLTSGKWITTMLGFETLRPCKPAQPYLCNMCRSIDQQIVSYHFCEPAVLWEIISQLYIYFAVYLRLAMQMPTTYGNMFEPLDSWYYCRNTVGIIRLDWFDLISESKFYSDFLADCGYFFWVTDMSQKT